MKLMNMSYREDKVLSLAETALQDSIAANSKSNARRW